MQRHTTYGIILLISLIFSTLSAQEDQSTLVWQSEKQLSWDDFSAEPANKSFNVAMTYASIAYEYDELASGEYKLKFEVTFNKNRSWFKKAFFSDYILKHEQLHFDLYEVYARFMVKEIMENPRLNASTASQIVNGVFEKYFQKMKIAQHVYDKETKHSVNKGSQKEWNDRVKTLLEDTAEYQHKTVVFKK